MLAVTAAPLCLPVEGGYTVKTLGASGDINQVCQLIGEVFEPAVGVLMRNLLHEYPGLEPADQFFVQDAAGEVVSFLCLLPWEWQVGPVTLTVGEMAVVGTAERARRQGLVRAQVDPFKARLAARGCVLSIIQGIPYFYRQFGYDYALPLEGGWRLEYHQVPAQVDGAYTIRRGTRADTPALIDLHAAAVAPLDIYARRSPELWEYLMAPYTTPDAGSRQTWLLINAAGEIESYVRLPEFHFGTELVVDEASRFTFDGALAMLAHLRRRGQAAGQPFIRLNLPVGSELVKVAQALGAADQGTYAWQLHIPDLAQLIRTLAPALDERLAASVFREWTREVRMGLYQGGLRLQFAQGKLVQVEDLPRGPYDFSLPPMALVPLIFGHRSLEETRAAFPDTNVHGQWRLLVETLFPRMTAFIFPNS